MRLTRWSACRFALVAVRAGATVRQLLDPGHLLRRGPQLRPRSGVPGRRRRCGVPPVHGQRRPQGGGQCHLHSGRRGGAERFTSRDTSDGRAPAGTPDAALGVPFRLPAEINQRGQTLPGRGTVTERDPALARTSAPSAARMRAASRPNSTCPGPRGLAARSGGRSPLSRERTRSWACSNIPGPARADGPAAGQPVMPVKDPAMTLAQITAAARGHLPGAVLRRRFFAAPWAGTSHR